MSNLNFNSVKKKHLTVTLNDEENTTLLIMSPTKRIMDSLVSIENLIRSSEDVDTDDNEQIDEQIDELYQLCTSIMNRNKGKIKISKNQLEEFFDIEDIMIFLKAYMSFIGSQIPEKN